MITTYCQNQIVVSITKLIMIIKSVYQGIRIVIQNNNVIFFTDVIISDS